MARLFLSLLGSPSVHHDGHPVSFQTRKTAALLVYLAVEGGLHRREKLAALLWPESDEERARGTLRSTLNFLRVALDHTSSDGVPHLLVERDQLGCETGVELDLEELEAAWQLARAPSSLPPAQLIARLQSALGCYRGDFLDGFSLPDAPAFESWAALQRETLRRRLDLIFDRLSQEQSEGGAPHDAIETALRWAAFDPLNETAHRRLMRLHVAAGDRTGALRAYEVCRQVLDDELNTEPMPETEALAARIRSEAPPADQPPPQEPRIPIVTVDAPLVGRLDEHGQLATAYRAARRGRTQLVSIEGEPGIGKTRLATEFLRWAAAQGADLLQGRAFESAGRLPYLPLADALRARIERENAPVDLLSDVWLAELSRLLPELRERYPDLPEPPGLGDEEARTRLGEALAARMPLVLLLDDRQWADAASLDAVQYAARRWAVAGVPALVVLCIRAEELNTTPALAEWLARLERDLPLTRIALGPLSPVDTARLVRSLDGDAAEHGSGFDAIGDWVYAETGGQPFFITELIKALVEREVLRPEPAGGWSAGTEQLAGLDGLLPSGVQAVIRARLAPLSTSARALLTAGAVLGHDFDFEPLCQICHLDPDEGLAAFDDLLVRRLLRESSRRYHFMHDKIREVVYVDAGEARRRLYHRRALDQLESQQAPPAELARHALAAGDGERAFRFSVAAGDAAMRVFAVRDAIDHYERARQLLAAEGHDQGHARHSVNDAERLHLYGQAGRAFELSARFPDARAVYGEMLNLARATGERALECAALNRLATVAANGFNDADAQASLLAEALAVAEQSGDPAGLVETEWNLARLLMFRSDVVAAWAHAGRALTLAREHGLTEPAGRTLNWMAIIETMVGRYADAVAQAGEARSLYATGGDRAMEADSLSHAAGALIRLGRAREGVAAARAGRRISLTIENSWGQAATAMQLALGLQECGEYAEALTTAQAGLAAARLTGYPVLQLLNLGQLGSVQRSLGLLEDARLTLDDAWALCGGIDYPAFKEWVAGELCAVHAASGDWDAAASYAREALALCSEHMSYCAFVRHIEIEALLRAGDVEGAEMDLRDTARLAELGPRMRLVYLRSSALLADWRGEIHEATDALAETRTLAIEMGLPEQRWQIAAGLAVLHKWAGDHERAKVAAEEAEQVIDALAGGLPDESLRVRFREAALALPSAIGERSYETRVTIGRALT